jgi:hypothetical protein
MDEHSWATQAERHESRASCRTKLAEEGGRTALVMVARFRMARLQYCLQDHSGVRDDLCTPHPVCRYTHAMRGRTHE